MRLIDPNDSRPPPQPISNPSTRTVSPEPAADVLDSDATQDSPPTASELARAARLAGVPVVRDDPTGTLSSSLQRQIETGHMVILMGEAIEQHTPSGPEFEDWQGELQAWRIASARMLRVQFAREAVQEFLYATRPPRRPETQTQPLHRELRAAENGVELLSTLKNSLIGRGGPGDGTARPR